MQAIRLAAIPTPPWFGRPRWRRGGMGFGPCTRRRAALVGALASLSLLAEELERVGLTGGGWATPSLVASAHAAPTAAAPAVAAPALGTSSAEVSERLAAAPASSATTLATAAPTPRPEAESTKASGIQVITGIFSCLGLEAYPLLDSAARANVSLVVLHESVGGGRCRWMEGTRPGVTMVDVGRDFGRVRCPEDRFLLYLARYLESKAEGGQTPELLLILASASETVLAGSPVPYMLDFSASRRDVLFVQQRWRTLEQATDLQREFKTWKLDFSDYRTERLLSFAAWGGESRLVARLLDAVKDKLRTSLAALQKSEACAWQALLTHALREALPGVRVVSDFANVDSEQKHDVLLRPRG